MNKNIEKPQRATYASISALCSKRPGNDATGSSIMKFGCSQASTNNLDGKMLLLDEAHNMVTSNDIGDRLATFRTQLRTASDTFVVAFTATPIVSQSRDGDELLEALACNGHPAQIVSLDPSKCQFYPSTMPANVIDGSVLFRKGQAARSKRWLIPTMFWWLSDRIRSMAIAIAKAIRDSIASGNSPEGSGITRIAKLVVESGSGRHR